MTRRGAGDGSSLKIGSRGSRLALAQTAVVVDGLKALVPGRTVKIVIVQTEGDLDKSSPLTEIGGRGVFTSALEAALLRGEIDAAVHSAKDLPTSLHPAAPVAAFLDRIDPRDVLVAREGHALDGLPPDAVIGTSSRRRDVQIRKLRPDSRPVSIRGNIDTRLRKLDRGDFDAILLAAAGLHRVGWEERISQYFSVDEMIPSPAQGALAVQVRVETDAETWLAALNDPCVAVPVGAERAFLAALGAGCAVPVGAFAAFDGDQLRLRTMLATVDGTRVVEADDFLDPGHESEHAADIGRRLQSALGSRPTPQWNGWGGNSHELDGVRVIVTRPRTQAHALLAALAARGAEAIAFPTIRIEPLPDTAVLDAALRDAERGSFSWLVFTSVNAVRAVGARLHAPSRDSAILPTVAVAAVGRSTAAAASQLGLNVVATPAEATGKALSAELRSQIHAGDRVLYPASALGREELPDALRAMGAIVSVIPVYTTTTEVDIDDAILDRIRCFEYDLITFSSPSAVKNFVALVGCDGDAALRGRAICGGPVTAEAARDAGFEVVAVATHPGSAELADAAVAYWRHHRDNVPREEMTAFAIGGRSTD